LLREDWRGWALAASLALATHYFAVFIVVPQLGWLVWRHARDSQAAAIASGAVVVVGAALTPLAIVQAGGNRAAYIHTSALGGRIAAVPKQFLIGYATPHQTLLAILAAALALALVLGLRRRDRGLAALAAIAAGLPALLALAGIDFLITRNVIAAIVPLVVLAAVAATRTRAGPALIAGLAAIGIIAFAGVEANALYQRDDWRALAKALGPATNGQRAIVLDPPSGAPALEYYTPTLHTLPAGAPLTVREIDVIDLHHNPRHPDAGVRRRALLRAEPGHRRPGPPRWPQTRRGAAAAAGRRLGRVGFPAQPQRQPDDPAHGEQRRDAGDRPDPPGGTRGGHQRECGGADREDQAVPAPREARPLDALRLTVRSAENSSDDRWHGSQIVERRGPRRRERTEHRPDARRGKGAVGESPLPRICPPSLRSAASTPSRAPSPGRART
jgi:hypothetical protein